MKRTPFADFSDERGSSH